MSNIFEPQKYYGTGKYFCSNFVNFAIYCPKTIFLRIVCINFFVPRNSWHMIFSPESVRVYIILGPKKYRLNKGCFYSKTFKRAVVLAVLWSDFGCTFIIVPQLTLGCDSEGRAFWSRLGLKTKGTETLGLVLVSYKILELVSSQMKIFGTVSSRSRLIELIFT